MINIYLGQITLLERFVFSAIRSFLVLYCIYTLHYTESYAYHMLTIFLTLSNITPLIGGIISDCILGPSCSLIVGSFLMSMGALSLLLLPNKIFIGLPLIIMSNGLLRPTVATLFGHFNRKDKEKNFTHYIIVSRIGTLIGPLLCTMVSNLYGQVKSFVIILIISLICIFFSIKVYKKVTENVLRTKINYSQIGIVCVIITTSAIGCYIIMTYRNYIDYIIGCMSAILLLGSGYLSMKNKHHAILFLIILLLSLFNIIFWSLFEQISSTINIFTHGYVDKRMWTALSHIPLIKGNEIPTSFFQAINGILVIFLIPFLYLIEIFFKKKHIAYQEYTKVGIGLILAGSSYGVLTYALHFLEINNSLLELHWLLLFYLFITIGEVMVGAGGLVFISNLVSESAYSFAMGLWQFPRAFSNWLIGIITMKFIINTHNMDQIHSFYLLFQNMFLLGIVAGISMIIFFKIFHYKKLI